MIKVSLTKSENGITVAFSGHAGYRQHGNDIVCAGVSALFYALTLGLRKLSPEQVKTRGETITVTNITPEIIGAITAIFEGLRAIEKTYPENVTVICPFGA